MGPNFYVIFFDNICNSKIIFNDSHKKKKKKNEDFWRRKISYFGWSLTIWSMGLWLLLNRHSVSPHFAIYIRANDATIIFLTGPRRVFFFLHSLPLWTKQNSMLGSRSTFVLGRPEQSFSPTIFSFWQIGRISGNQDDKNKEEIPPRTLPQ